MDKNFVHDVFSSVADRYDLMNTLMSFGLHKKWKREFVKRISSSLNHSIKVLDVACGTGDITYQIIKSIPNAEVHSCDINLDMIRIGVKEYTNKNLIKNFKFVCADAENLPFPCEYYDYYTIAFGIRNVHNREKALKEAYRVIKSGGKFLCLEFTPNKENSFFLKMYKLYSNFIIPKLGRLVAQDEKSYQYLIESIQEFPDQHIWSDIIHNAGFANVDHNDICKGILSIHSGIKI